jgi:molybdenum cofactor cytidylyltransferase
MRANLTDEAVTIATLPPYAVVARDDMIATVKIIPYAAPRDAVEKVAAAGRSSPIRVAAFRPMKAALITSEIGPQKESVVQKTRSAMAARLKPMGGTLDHEATIPHDATAVARALREADAAGAEMVFVLGASAISDVRDVVPDGIVQAGGSIVHYGMPVDPGNLLLLAQMNGKPVIGLPGCARSRRINGLDFVLRRLFAGLRVTREDIMKMGVGGLLGDIPERPFPRRNADAEAPVKMPRAARIAGIVLAGGMSSRMGSNKLLADVAGMPLVRRTVMAAAASELSPVIVVTGNEPEKTRAALKGLDVVFAHNPDYAAGLSTSLRAGLTAIPDSADGAMVLLGDMPEISPALIARLIAAFSPEEGRAIVVATANARRGNPVLWARRYFSEMEQITGDTGAKHLIAVHEEMVCEVEADDSAFHDIDTPEALAALRERQTRAHAS